jgi:hypothetical protein
VNGGEGEGGPTITCEAGHTRASWRRDCLECSRVKLRARVAAWWAEDGPRLLKAKGVPPSAHEGAVFLTDGVGPHDGFWSSVEEFLDWCQGEGATPPERVWACRKVPLQLDSARDLVSAAAESLELYEDVTDDVDGDELALLQKAIDRFNETCSAFSWFADFDEAVVLRETAR